MYRRITLYGLCLFVSFVTTSFTYLTVPKAFLRIEPAPLGEIESEAFYGEPLTVLKSEGDWLFVEMNDQERGWLKKSDVTERSQAYPTPGSAIVQVNRRAAHVYHITSTEHGPLFTLPFESCLEVVEQIEGPKGRWLSVKGPDGRECFIQRGDIVSQQKQLTREEMVAFSKKFIGLPYTWGGRTSFGFDCSGFVQMLYRKMGISIPRNSRDQYKWEGFRQVSLDNLQPGDLIFFGTSEKITHVGMYIGEGKFIHSSIRENKPYLRINSLSVPPWDGSAAFTATRDARTLK